MKEKNIVQGIFFATLATIIWSGNFVVARAFNHDIPPVKLSFYRWLCATLILLPFAIRYFYKEWPIVKKNFHYFFWLALTGISLFNTFVYVGGRYTSAINLALIGTTTSPIIANILARIFLKEKIGWHKILGMMICIIGILILLAQGSLDHLLHFQFSKGDAWVLLAAFCFAVYNTLVKKKPADVSPVNFLFTSFGLGSLFLLPVFIYESGNTSPITWNWQLAAVIIYLGLGASVICYFLWNKAIHALGAGRTALFGNLIPVFSSIEAVILLNERFTLFHVISMLLVFIGLIVANLRGKS